MTAIEQRAAFDYIRYANCWEDTEALLTGLAVQPGARCLSIASAGDNSLALLTARPERVVAVDLNPVQLACVDLRMVSIRRLAYEDWLRFMGFAGDGKAGYRTGVYQSLRGELTRGARDWWDRNTEAIEKGIIHTGKFERFFHLFRRWMLPLVHSRKRVAGLLTERNRDGRHQYYREVWDTPRWRGLFRLFFSRRVMGRLGRDPEFFRYVEGPVAEHIRGRVAHALTELPTHDNPYLTYILTGSFGDRLPFYARRDNFDIIRAHLDHLELRQGTAEGIAETISEPFDAFNLSDIFEYMDEAFFRTVAERLLNRANPEARFAYWNMLVPRRIATLFPDRVRTLEDLSRRCHEQDRAFFYQRFIVDEVMP
ncbi:MAG: DUF3419 family protein [Thermodesulfobacteriota bacterium]